MFAAVIGFRCILNQWRKENEEMKQIGKENE
jgi:hypothetical protein